MNPLVINYPCQRAEVGDGVIHKDPVWHSVKTKDAPESGLRTIKLPILSAVKCKKRL